MKNEDRNKLLSNLSKMPEGQALREELAMKMQEVESVLSISDKIIVGDDKRLAIETCARRLASQYLNEVLLKLIPLEGIVNKKQIIR